MRRSFSDWPTSLIDQAEAISMSVLAPNREFAPAKINLFLHIVGRRTDGYHLLESLFAFVDFGDELMAEPADTFCVTVDGPQAFSLAGEGDSLVHRAAATLFGQALPKLHIRITKNIPVAAGLGGGSADAAAALRLLNRMFGLDLPMDELANMAAGIGADVPACLWSQTCLGQGVGERLSPTAIDTRPWVLLVKPPEPMPTPAVFQAYKDSGAAFTGLLADAGRPLWSLHEISALGNDLAPPACAINPVLPPLLKALGQRDNAALVRLSGSGPTCFALYGDRLSAESAKASISTAFPQTWSHVCRLR